ncbi:MAG: right-handed parallel beta-helix repeat-containing protein [Bacteroidetes bacterium]|nr:right-handed parallel beta-helix repeat-containing protein [Bacteroidota bacterium]
MKNLLLILGFLLPQLIQAQGREEFNGPYNSWANVRQRFGAKGDGKTDDTKALQRAIDSLSCPPTRFNTGKQGYTVVYLPAGTYCISSTLVLRGRIGVSIVGEDPANTTIKWTGPEKDTLLWTDGSAYFKVARLTWDANKRQGMEGIGVHWKTRWEDAKSRSFATLNIELSDNIFVGGFRFGISGGTYGTGTGYNDSEIAIRRCTFKGCTEAGIEIMGYNALDYWVWDCKFLNCGSGIHCSYGGYHAYRSYFSGSSVAGDLHNMHGYYNSVRGCYSVNSRMFSVDEAITSNPFKRIFQDNTVINARGYPVLYYHLGKITLFDNRFTKSKDTSVKLSVLTNSWAPGIYEVLSLGNVYQYKDPIKIDVPVKKLYSVGDKQGEITNDTARFLKTLATTPARVSRKVLEVPAGAGSAEIQAVIDKAAQMKGQRPVVHFPMGTYTLDGPLVIPAASDMQLTGDGLIYASVLVRKAGTRVDQPLIRIKGPSYSSISELQLGVDGNDDPSTAIQFDGVDQPGSQAHLDQIYSHADTSVALRELDNLYVQKDNSFFTDGNAVTGGPLVRKGGGTAGLYCYGGQFEHVRVEGNGRFLARDCWWEGETRVPLDLQGNGTICIDGAMIAPNGSDSMPSIRIGKFNGNISLMNMYLQGALLPEGNNPGLNLLAWNIHFYHKMDPLDFLRKGGSFKGAFAGLTAQCFVPNSPACKDIISIEDRTQNIPDINAFLDKSTAFDRSAKPVPYGILPAGSSNIYLSRVSIVGTRKNAIVFTR